MATLDIYTVVVAYSDPVATANPSKRHVDWSRKVQSIPVSQPTSTQHVLEPGEVRELFSGTRALTVDSTTELELVSKGNSKYELRHVGGTAPGFRTARPLLIDGLDITVEVNNNATASFSVPAEAAEPFGAVTPGDTLHVAGSSFSPLNRGHWQVLSKSHNKLVVRRFPGEIFEGLSEAGVRPAPGELTVFSSTGVQPEDKVAFGDGFAPMTQRTFTVTDVTATTLKFVSTDSLPEETVIGGDVSIYKDAKRYVRIEVNGEVVVRVNGDTQGRLVVSPLDLPDGERLGWADICGPIYALIVENREVSPVTVNIITCE